MNNNSNVILFALRAGKELASLVSKKLNIKLSDMNVTEFADGEILVKPKVSVRNKDVFLIQSTSNPVNTNIMELLIAIDAIKRGSAKTINVIIPYYGYARQDRKSKGREPITSKLVANILEVAGADRVITFDLHSPQSVGFFNIPVDDLRPITEISTWIFDYVIKNNLKNSVVLVSPDHGGLVRVKNIANKLQTINPGLAVIDKSRSAPNVSKIDFVLGDVENKTCFIIDDMIDTAGTICNAAKALMERKAKEVILMATHPVLSNPACDNMNKLVKSGVIKKIVFTDTIPWDKNKKINNLEIVSVSDFLANVIKTITSNKSISELYQLRNKKLLQKISQNKKTK